MGLLLVLARRMVVCLSLFLFHSLFAKMSPNAERTYLMIKPDGVQRGLVGDIIKRFEQKGFKLVALKFLQPSEELLKQHYADLSERKFFPGLVAYMASPPVVAMVWEGLNVVKTGRVMLGETDPAASKPGTIRGDYSIQIGRNIIHGSTLLKAQTRRLLCGSRKMSLLTGAHTQLTGSMNKLLHGNRCWMGNYNLGSFTAMNIQ